MKPFSLFTLLCCLMSAGCFTTKYSKSPALEYPNKYADKLEPGSKLEASTFTSTFERTSNGSYIYKAYYPETRQMTHFMSFKGGTTRTPHGPNKEWWDDGTLVFEGEYIDGQRSGEWTEYDHSNFGSNSNFVSKGKYLNNLKTGTWVTIDSLGNKRSEMSYEKEKLSGPFKRWNKKGMLYNEGEYKDGKLLWEKNYSDGTANPDTFSLVKKIPEFSGCDGVEPDSTRRACAERKMLEFIYGQIKYPKLARENGIEGKAIVNFVVDKDGTVTGIKVKRGICKEIKTECERVMQLMPKWNPGMQKGKPVRVLFNLPLKFKLE
ncbi:MAG: TonB family protein [Saprospiraceae bacterium]|nr:TonB family protein [Saprospiraceae bacterium]